MVDCLLLGIFRDSGDSLALPSLLMEIAIPLFASCSIEEHRIFEALQVVEHRDYGQARWAEIGCPKRAEEKLCAMRAVARPSLLDS